MVRHLSFHHHPSCISCRSFIHTSTHPSIVASVRLFVCPFVRLFVRARCPLYARPSACSVRLLRFESRVSLSPPSNPLLFCTVQASTPLLISIADYVWLGRELPSTRSWICLVTLLVGAACYAYTDKNFNVDAYFWVVIWFAVFSFDQVCEGALYCPALRLCLQKRFPVM